jgi:hypothetical protein
MTSASGSSNFLTFSLNICNFFFSASWCFSINAFWAEIDQERKISLFKAMIQCQQNIDISWITRNSFETVSLT